MIDKITKYFGIDGLLHIICSNLIVVLLNLLLPLWVAVIIAIVIGLVKEFVYDKALNNGTCDNKDLIADAIGIVIGCL